MLFWIGPQQHRKQKQKLPSGIMPNFCTAKETINRVCRCPAEWENIYASFSPDRGLISIIYTELKKIFKKAK
jgi:hypothetical protein